MPGVYDPVPAGFLRTGLMAGVIEGRVVAFGNTEDRIQQDVPVPDIATLEAPSYDMGQSGSAMPQTLVTENHYGFDLVNTILERITGFSAWYVHPTSTSPSSGTSPPSQL